MYWYPQGQWYEVGERSAEAESWRHPVPHLLLDQQCLHKQHQLHQDPVTGASTKISDRYQEGRGDYNKIRVLHPGQLQAETVLEGRIHSLCQVIFVHLQLMKCKLLLFFNDSILILSPSPLLLGNIGILTAFVIGVVTAQSSTLICLPSTALAAGTHT